MQEDFGILLVRPNCFSRKDHPDSRVVLCYGAHTYGTEATAHVYFRPNTAAELARWLRSRRQSTTAFDALVRVIGDPKSVSTVRGLNTQRQITIVQPNELSNVISFNPVIEQALNEAVNASSWRITQRVISRIWLGASAAIFGWGMYLHVLPLVFLGAAILLLQIAAANAVEALQNPANRAAKTPM